MIKNKEFSPSVIEKLGYYVYLLIDPETDKVFYIGKGYGNRVFSHVNLALASPLESDKLEKIRSIHAKGMEVKLVIQRHGLTEKEAFEVEASLIDFVSLNELSNNVLGFHSDLHGSMGINEVIAMYEAPIIEITEPSILVIVNTLFERGITEERLYEITRGNWVLGEKRNKARYAFSIFKGIVRQVYEIKSWFPVEARTQEEKTKLRWRFNGIVAKDLQHYVGGSVEKYISRGAQNPIKYINC